MTPAVRMSQAFQDAAAWVSKTGKASLAAVALALKSSTIAWASPPSLSMSGWFGSKMETESVPSLTAPRPSSGPGAGKRLNIIGGR